jgi:hypothetical protein
VSLFRERAVKLGRIPTQTEYEEISSRPVPTPPETDVDFDKLWADHLDRAPATLNRLLPPT